MKNMLLFLLVFVLLPTLCACKQKEVTPTTNPPVPSTEATEALTLPSVTDEPTKAPTEAPPLPPTEPLPPADTELVRVKDYIPDIYVELKYATEDNSTGQIIYDFDEAYLRYGTVKKLAAIQEQLSKQDYSLKIWDAYRPQEAQFVLWEVVPDSTFVANPYTGHSSHSSGGTVDISLVLSDGTEIEMPTGFDAFSALADRDYSDVSETPRQNALILENTMKAGGFTPYFNEWWHYTDTDKYPYDDVDGIPLSGSDQSV